jgi:hypothetical protein
MTLSGCAGEATPSSSAEQFMSSLSELCGNTYTGSVVSKQAVDADWRAAPLTLGPVECEAGAVHAPLAVGEDRSRTWHITRDGETVELRHEHRLKDGSPDPVSYYGGYSNADSTSSAMYFPADEASKTMFVENGLDVSVANVWTLSIEDGVLRYALARPERDFRAEFVIGE